MALFAAAAAFRPDLLAALLEPRRAPVPFTEHVIRASGGHDLHARVWPGRNARKDAPWAVWTHGGGFCSGNHLAPPQWVNAGLVERGYHVVSHSYRLAPHATVDDMLQDCQDVVAWARASIARIVGGLVDTDRLVLVGDSAGGYLSASLAMRLQPAPKAMVLLYALTDLVAQHKGSRPPVAWTGRWPEDELRAAVADRDPRNACTVALNEQEHVRFPVEHLQVCWSAPWLRYDERILLQASLAQYMGMKGMILSSPFRQDTFAGEDDYLDHLGARSPLQLLDTAAAFPPTAFMHGTADKLVSVEQSRAMARKLRAMDVPTVETYEVGAPHVHDIVYHDESTPGWGEQVEPILRFVDLHVA